MAQLLGYGEIENVEAGSEKTIIEVREEHQSSLITQVLCSGTIFAEYIVYARGNKIATGRSGPSRNMSFNFVEPFSLGEKITLNVNVIHYRLNEMADFECAVFAIRN